MVGGLANCCDKDKGTSYLLEQLEREGVNINWGNVANMVSALSLDYVI